MMHAAGMTTSPLSPFRPDLLQGHVALVTGGATGLGLEIATVLGAHGARVAICSRKEDNLRAAVEKLTAGGAEAMYGVCDVRRPEEVKAVIDAVLARFGRIDIVVNNAAGNFPVPITGMSRTPSRRWWTSICLERSTSPSWPMSRGCATTGARSSM